MSTFATDGFSLPLIRILLVEDDQIDHLAFIRSVKQAGLFYDYTIARSLTEARNILSQQTFEIAILDHNLGDGYSTDLFPILKAQRCPFIISTGSGDEATAARLMGEGAADYLIKDPDRNYLKILPATVEKAIARNQAEEQIRLLTQAIESVKDSIYIADLDGRLLFVNQSLRQICNLPTTDMIGCSIECLGQPCLTERMTFDPCSSEACAVEVEIDLHRPDGTTFPGLLSESCIQHRQTQVRVGVIRDITPLKHVELELRAAREELEHQVAKRTAELQQALNFEALLKRITDHVRDSLDEAQILQTAVQELAHGLAISACDTGIYDLEQTTSTIAYEFTNTLTSAQGLTFKLVHAAHPEIYPYLLSGQISQFCDIAPHPLRADQRFQTTLAVPIVDDQGVLGDLWLFKPPDDRFNDQELRLVQQVATQCAIALRQSRLYQAAQAQVQELERLNQLKDDFLSTVSHELRSPLASIQMATKMLEISLKPLGILDNAAHPIHRYIKVLQEEERREMTLINDLLDLTRLDAGTEPLQLAPIDLQLYLSHLLEPFIERIQQQQQQLAIHLPHNLPPFTTDVPYLERILTELLHNACKYTPARGTIAIAAQFTGEALEIRVSNSGVEIPATEYDRIFDKFYRIPNNDPWKHGGTGLGLTLVKKLTERLGGQIHIESGKGQTTFMLKFGGFPQAIQSTLEGNEPL